VSNGSQNGTRWDFWAFREGSNQEYLGRLPEDMNVAKVKVCTEFYVDLEMAECTYFDGESQESEMARKICP
jgi:hypothetical protein